MARLRHPVNVAQQEGKTRVEEYVDRFVQVFGSVKFLAWQTVAITIWILVNSLALSFSWDPAPFILLNLLFSTQAAYAAPLILLSQNRQTEHDRLKAEHDYQVNEEALAILRRFLPSAVGGAEAQAELIVKRNEPWP